MRDNPQLRTDFPIHQVWPTVKINQVWKEVDPRFDRWVRVVGMEDGKAKALLQECDALGVVFLPDHKPSRGKLERFNGRRGGYAFVMTCPT